MQVNWELGLPLLSTQLLFSDKFDKDHILFFTRSSAQQNEYRATFDITFYKGKLVRTSMCLWNWIERRIRLGTLKKGLHENRSSVRYVAVRISSGFLRKRIHGFLLFNDVLHVDLKQKNKEIVFFLVALHCRILKSDSFYWSNNIQPAKLDRQIR